MRSVTFLPAILGLTAALPQGIDFASIADVAAPAVQGPPVTGVSEAPTYDPSKAASSAASQATADPVATASSKKRRSGIETRDACAQLPAGSGPVSSPDTAAAFLGNPTYSDAAENALTPDGYSLAFSALDAATQSPSYLGYYTLTSYDTVECAQYCDAVSTCYHFNIYFQRDPTVLPGAACPNPASATNYKCILFGAELTADAATNQGQFQEDFQIVIAGSNGYNSLAAPASETNFTGPSGRLGGAISAPLTADGTDTYIGMRLFAGPYDPSQCAAACQATTAFDRANAGEDGTYKACNFFNSYVLSKNGEAQGTYCSLYTQPWSASYATNAGQYDSDGNYYSVSQSYTYTLTEQDSGVVESS